MRIGDHHVASRGQRFPADMRQHAGNFMTRRQFFLTIVKDKVVDGVNVILYAVRRHGGDVSFPLAHQLGFQRDGACGFVFFEGKTEFVIADDDRLNGAELQRRRQRFFTAVRLGAQQAFQLVVVK